MNVRWAVDGTCNILLIKARVTNISCEGKEKENNAKINRFHELIGNVTIYLLFAIHVSAKIGIFPENPYA